MANRITVIFDDKMIYVDGVAIECNFSAHKDGLKAIQWDGTSGQMEIYDPEFRTVQAVYSVDVKPYYDIWLVEKARIDAEIQAGIDYANSPEGIAEAEMAQAKSDRAEAVDAIVVTVDGMEFDGDEDAQRRMTVAVSTAMSRADRVNSALNRAWELELQTNPDAPEPEYDNYLDYTTTWVLADNTIVTVTIAQLSHACELAGTAQTDLWTVPYE